LRTGDHRPARFHSRRRHCCRPARPGTADWTLGEFAFYAVYLGRRHLSAKVRVFIDYLVETLAG
jgi:DNA-binding transcriptional LysR family regulator